MKGLGVACALGCSLWGAHTTAQPSGAFRLTYTAGPDCPAAAEFAARISAHSPIARLAAEGEPARELRVTLEANAGGARGQLLFVAADAPVSERSVAGRDCREVADALALVAAIVIDPNAQVAIPQRAQSTAVGTADPTPEGAKPPPQQPKPSPQQPSPPPQQPPMRWQPAPEKLPDAAANGSSWRAGPAFQAGVVGPGLTPNLGVALLYGVEAALQTDGLFAPSLRLSGYHVKSDDVVTGAGRARFQWTVGRLSACPLRWSVAFLGIRPCVIGDVGRVLGEGYETVDPAEQPRLWVALGAALRAETEVFRVLSIEVELGASFPFSKDRFFFDPNVSAYEVGPGGYALLGIGLRFP